VVLKSLMKATLKVRHEGFAHMGASRMLETIRLRYYWPKINEDIVEHSRELKRIVGERLLGRQSVSPSGLNWLVKIVKG
jgi:hypothetical protein